MTADDAATLATVAGLLTFWVWALNQTGRADR